MRSLIIAILFLINKVSSTIDINLAELEYLSNHLEPEECRKLIAAVHFKSYAEPNALGEAENKISKDISCLDLLLHWNSAKDEGKGETHEVLEHRLRQMGKYELADWLGKTVFRQLGKDLEHSLSSGLSETANDTIEFHKSPQQISDLLAKEVKQSDPKEWSIFDTFFYSVGIELIVAIIFVMILASLACLREFCRRRINSKSYKGFKLLENSDLDKDEKLQRTYRKEEDTAV